MSTLDVFWYSLSAMVCVQWYVLLPWVKLKITVWAWSRWDLGLVGLIAYYWPGIHPLDLAVRHRKVWWSGPPHPCARSVRRLNFRKPALPLIGQRLRLSHAESTSILNLFGVLPNLRCRPVYAILARWHITTLCEMALLKLFKLKKLNFHFEVPWLFNMLLNNLKIQLPTFCWN